MMYDFALINLFETFNKSDFQMMDGILILGRNACVCCMSIYIVRCTCTEYNGAILSSLTSIFQL